MNQTSSFHRMMNYCMNLHTTWSINSPGLYLDEAARLCSACNPCFCSDGGGSAGRRIRFVTLISYSTNNPKNTFFNACIIVEVLLLYSGVRKLVFVDLFQALCCSTGPRCPLGSFFSRHDELCSALEEQ